MQFSKLNKFNFSILKKNEKGQIAIFVALVFQVLFVFFAMVINVGLLIHHKVNLQNSADLAAYYGAMKQTEVLNAMAHVNYQIRQAWKLFVWRYRVLGTYGHKFSPGSPGGSTFHPANISFDAAGTPSMGSFLGINNGRIAEDRTSNTATQLWYQRPLFCISHQGMSGWPKENLCKVDVGTVSSGAAFTTRSPPTIQIMGSQIGGAFAGRVNDAIRTLATTMYNQCIATRRINYAVAGTLLFAFQADQAVRKATFKKLYEILTEANSDPGAARDLDNESMAEGVFKTLINNLSEPNRNSIGESWSSPKGDTEFEVNFGLGDPACNNFSSNNSDTSAFTSNDIFPDVFYLGSECADGAGSTQAYVPRHLSNFGPELGGSNNIDDCNAAGMEGVLEYACQVKKLVYASQAEMQMSMGYSKNPKCAPFTGVKVTTTPKIPFLPTEIKLTARSYAQAFGGSIGPYWNKKYLETAASVNTTSAIEGTVSPIRVSGDTTPNTSISDTAEGANYAKYPGDQFGLGSDAVLAHYAGLMSDPRVPKPALSSWEHIIKKNFENFLIENNEEFRKIELSAIVPNLFDITYYSIEPDFYNMYYTKMIKRLGPKVPISALNIELDIRPDIGSIKDPSTLLYNNYSVHNQLFEIEELMNRTTTNLTSTLYTGLPWMISNQGNVLTSWNFSKFGDYLNNPNEADFWKKYVGVCWEDASREKQVDNQYQPDKEINEATKSTKAPTTGNCITGGRTGFSVRLVSQKYLTESLKVKLPNGWE